MKKEKKPEIVREMHEKLLKSRGVFLVDFTGLNVASLMSVRARMKESEGELKVVKNTLLRIALSDTDYLPVSKFLTGNNAIVFAYQDPIATAKQLVKSAEEFEHLTLKEGFIPGGEVLDAQGVEILSKIPGREELLGKLAYLFSYPVQGLVNVTSGIVKNLITILEQIKQTKEKLAA